MATSGNEDRPELSRQGPSEAAAQPSRRQDDLLDLRRLRRLAHPFDHLFRRSLVSASLVFN